MATYRVIQDIEAEDKLLGPLSLREFIYAIITVVLLFIAFKLALVQPLLAIPVLPPAALFAVLAAPFGHDQSSEVWLLAKIRFLLKPQRRIWDQTGLQEMVTVTAPKAVRTDFTNDLNQDQVKSRLEALAQTIDTRGWVVKGVDVNMFTSPSYASSAAQSDRLVSPTAVSNVPDTDVRSDDDILDDQNNPVAHQMAQLVQAKDTAHRQALLSQMQDIRESQAAGVTAAVQTPTIIEPTPVYVEPVQSYQTAPAQPQVAAVEPVTTPRNESANAAILGLANNNDLTIATIARQAHRDETSDEVVVSLR